MKLIDKLLVKLQGKKDFKIDDKISTGYILRMCLEVWLDDDSRKNIFFWTS